MLLHAAYRLMGALTIRLPDSLHAHLRRLADEEGLSMNQFAMLAVAEKIARLDEGAAWLYTDAVTHVGADLASGDGPSLRAAARAILDRAPDVEPLPPAEDDARPDAPDPAFDLGRDPVDDDATDASTDHDRHLYGA
jgi:hypothetical protein